MLGAKAPGRIRAALIIRGQLPNRAEIGLLGGGHQPTNGHILNHALLEWSYGVLLVRVIHTSGHAVWSSTSRVSAHHVELATEEERRIMRQEPRQTNYCRASGFVQLAKVGKGWK
jgi:hypothetical protein